MTATRVLLGPHPLVVDWLLVAYVNPATGHVSVYVGFDCPECGTYAEQRKWHVDSNRRRGKRGPFCSRSCGSRQLRPNRHPNRTQHA